MSKAEALTEADIRTLESLSAEKSLRIEIVNKLEFLLNGKETSDVNTSGEILLKRMDSLIRIAYERVLMTENTSDEPENRIALYDLINLKDSWIHLESEDAEPFYDSNELEKEIKQQRSKLSRIDAQMQTLQKKEPANVVESVVPEDKLFHAQSIIRQVITSNLERGNSYRIQIAVDNKGIEDRKAFMPVPLQDGSIAQRYQGSDTPLVYSSRSDAVVSVCQGEVIYAKRVGGDAYTVIIMHDKAYFTVYSNLAQSYVSYGDTVNFEQSIGKARSSDEGSYEISFEIWNKKQSLNPLHWIKNA